MTCAKAPARLRLSVWGDVGKLVDGNGKPNMKPLAGTGGFVDDLSLLTTICHTSATTLKVDWDPDSLRFLNPSPIMKRDQATSDQMKKDSYAAIAQAVHKLGLEILAGYACLDPNPPKPVPALKADASDDEKAAHAKKVASFNADMQLYKTQKARFDAFNGWLNDACTGKASPTPAAYAKQVATFYKANLPDYDGLSFDIEGIAAVRAGATVDLMAAQLTIFFQTLATELKGKIVAVAGGGLVAKGIAHHNSGSNTGDQQAMQTAQIHAYEMAEKPPNLLMRPMVYDGQPTHAKGDEEGLFQWQSDVIDYALRKCNNGKGIPAANFQLGIKIHPGGLNKGIVSGTTKIQRRGALCRQPGNMVGLSIFALGGGEDWAKIDEGLNPKPTDCPVPKAGATGDEPRQAPKNKR